MSEPLKLTAADAEDLAIISSCLQDAIVPIVEMTYLADERSFVFIASRFGWEDAAGAPDDGAVYERINVAVQFDGVSAVKRRNVDQSLRRTMLSLLAIQPGQGYIDLIFAGGGMIRLESEAIHCRLDDLDHRWPTRWKPSHEQS